MFSYIVTGVIFVYNDTIVIFTCAFAIYGVYSAIKEILNVLGWKCRFIAAIYISDNADVDFIENAVEYTNCCICEHSFFESQPVFVADCVNAELFKDLKYTVYVKYTEEIWSGKTIR